MIALLSVAPPSSPRADEGAERLFPEIAPGGELQERLDTGARERDHGFAGHAALFGGVAGGGADKLREPREIGLAVQHQGVVALVGDDILAEGGAEGGEPLADGAEAGPGGVIQMRAGPAEGDVIALEHPVLLGGEVRGSFACGTARPPGRTRRCRDRCG